MPELCSSSAAAEQLQQKHHLSTLLLFNNPASTFLSGVYHKSLAAVEKVFYFLHHFTFPWVTFEAVAGSQAWLKSLGIAFLLHPSRRRRMDIFVNSWTAPKGPVCETAPALPFYFNSKFEVCKLGCVLWCWARCCLDSWGRAEIGRLIWSILGNWKWLPNHTIETSYELSLKWLFHECGCWSLNASRHIKFTANFPDRWMSPRHWD